MTFLKYIFLLLISFSTIFLAHKYVFNSYLRHGMVEDGSVSQFAGDLLDSRTIIEKYTAVLESDGRANGRYRPAYFVYETLPFILTVIKNEGYNFKLSRANIRKKINGDLRLHMMFLLSTVSLAIFVGSMVIYSSSKSYVYAAIFPLVVAFSPTLVRNITYNDTAEVPQLLWLSLYIGLFVLGEKFAGQGDKIKVFLVGIISFFVISFLYLTKETSVAVLPGIIVYILSVHLFWKRTPFKEKKLYLLNHTFHFLINTVMTIWVIFNVKRLKGGYASNYDIVSLGQVWETFKSYGEVLASFPPVVYIPVSSMLVAVLFAVYYKFTSGNNEEYKELIRSVLISFFIVCVAVVLLTLNLPWAYVLERYMLPVSFLLGLSGCILLGSISHTVLKGRAVVQAVLLLTVFFVSYKDVVSETHKIDSSYEKEFGSLKNVNTITENIIRTVGVNKTDCNVLLDVGKMSPTMWYQVARIVNLEGGVNVVVPGQKYPPERTYLKKVDGVKTVKLIPSDGDGYSNSFDIIYSAVSSNKEIGKEKRDQLLPLVDYFNKTRELPVIVNGNEVYSIFEFVKK